MPLHEAEGIEGVQLLTIPETSAVLRVSRRTVYELTNSGALKSIKVAGRRLVARQDLEAYISGLREAS